MCGAPLASEKLVLREFLNAYKTKKHELTLLGGSEEERERRMEILRFAVDEIRGADWKEGEEEELLQKRTKINNLEKILFSVKEALEYISSDGGACDALRGARRALNAVAGLDKEYEKLTDTLENIAEEAEDASSALSEIADGLYFDENEATYVENRLDELRSLQRKYGVKTQEEIVVLLSEKGAGIRRAGKQCRAFGKVAERDFPGC